jgi:hypothetical protein
MSTKKALDEVTFTERARLRRQRDRGVPTVKYVYWQEDDMWLGYLDEYPDHMTQGASFEELQENLRDIYCDITSGQVPSARKLAELRVS